MSNIKYFRAGLIAFGSLLLARGVIAGTEKKPNLLFIMTDQQRFDALSIAGNTVLQTPNLDRLARQGAWFRNAYTQCAVCAPARASILTGCTVENHGILTNALANSIESLGKMAMPTFDKLLKQNGGYRVEYYGKWHSPEFAAAVYENPVLKAKSGKSIFAPGGIDDIYEDYLDPIFPVSPLKPGELYDSYTHRPYTMNPLDKRYGMTDAQVKASGIVYIQPDYHGVISIPPEYSLTAFWVSRTIDALERNKNIPFSITCSLHFPHAPMLPVRLYSDMYPANMMPVPVSIADPMSNSPYRSQNGRLTNPEYADQEKIKYMVADYYAIVKEIDVWVGKILDKLTELGLDDNTLVIFTSDHGEMLGSHGMREKNVFYEESAHIPLLIRFPGQIKSGTTVEGYVSNINLFATINDYLKMPESPSDGKSLRGLIEGTDKMQGQVVVTEWLYNDDKQPAYMIIKEDWKMFIPYTAESKVINALYNLKEDPFEMNNLLGNNPDRQKYKQKAEELRDELLLWLKKHNSKYYEGVKNRNLLGTDQTSGFIHRPVKQFRIYPNPASKQVSVDTENLKIDKIDIYDLNGRVVYSDNVPFTGLKKIDLELIPGFYLIKTKSVYQFPTQEILIE